MSPHPTTPSTSKSADGLAQANSKSANPSAHLTEARVQSHR
ncbi:MAG: hypothetical protein RLP44_01655 [Aggregatilineales bacterium]